MNDDIQLFPCYSLNLRNYLTSKNVKYKLTGLNPNSHKMFWLYIDNEQLNKYLVEWKRTKPKI